VDMGMVIVVEVDMHMALDHTTDLTIEKIMEIIQQEMVVEMVDLFPDIME